MNCMDYNACIGYNIEVESVQNMHVLIFYHTIKKGTLKSFFLGGKGLHMRRFG